ncbi:wfs1 [Drosophila busckii]|uniref:Wfs1 n=1 Tax=Drosophila busckii TaxID=30019 RepID=A0A0M5J5I5_DROBS|nr:wolframin [Drosophila busckii]XP_017848856.1 wolframin [Drosophila busckii]ALC47781.1 wfs1 [Drosophila busckii]
MATWTQNVPTGVTKRRRWNLEDRASLNKLKEHIAEEGCPQVQYDLGKKLLENAIEPNVANESQKAVHWLVSAAQQGHEDAVQLLRKCYNDGNGITIDNADEVRRCLAMTPGERAARKAARELFACLSNGNEHITPKQLERKMRRIYNLQRKRRRRGVSTDDASSSNTDEESSEWEREPLEDPATIGRTNVERRRFITEANLVSAASNYSAGRMPSVNEALTLSVPHPHSLDHVPCFYRLIFHPLVFFTLLYHRFINVVAALPSMLPLSVRCCLLMVISWGSIAGDRERYMLPLVSYYLSLGVMLWATCKMLKTKQQFVDFRIWSGLFLSYGDHNIEADISEQRFLRNNMKPYLFFFCAFICNLIVYPLVTDAWLPHSELTIISGACTFVTLAMFMYASSQLLPDWLVIVSFAVNVLAKYPYELDEVVSTYWRFLDLRVPTFSSFVIGNGIEFCLNCRTALYLLIPVLLVLLAKRARWHGVYTYLIPHCVTLSWLQVCIVTSQSATVFGAMRAALGLAGLVLFLPLFGIVALLVPVFVAIDSLGLSSEHLRWGTTAIACSFVLLLSCALALNRATQKYITILQLLIGLITVCVLVFPYMTSSFKDTPRFHAMPSIDSTPSVSNQSPTGSLQWQRFYELCLQPVTEQPNKIKAQLRCSHLNGVHVAWQGKVTYVQISSVSNRLEHIIANYFPNWLGKLLRCVHGERIAQHFQCGAEEDEHCVEWLRTLKTLGGHTESCTLQNWNRYEYELLVQLPAGGNLLRGSTTSNVVIRAQHDFGNFTQRLQQGDRILFYGILQSSNRIREQHAPEVQLKTIECLHCQSPELGSVSIQRTVLSSPVDARLQDLMRGIKYLLNALLSPLITFK